MALSNKQAAFVEAYLRSWNATRAAKDAGYSDKTAYSIGQRLLKNVEIANAISERIAERAMSANEVLDRLAQQARGSIEDIGEISQYGTFSLDLSEAKKNGTVHLIKKFKTVMLGYEVELYDAQAALQLLGRHHKLFVDRVEVDDTGLSDDQRAARIAAFLDAARARRDREVAGGVEVGDVAATEGAAEQGASE